ncbi:prepilin-type N-terminal cleavage/methylation domain-containing protein, partial [Deinococcus sp. 6GRE01]|nr:prepilin-type N-terminal cleavage/methylation domain-containing protein [Deinococcus sp. 6GRE01]
MAPTSLSTRPASTPTTSSASDMPPRTPGFTLIEILLVTALLGLLA